MPAATDGVWIDKGNFQVSATTIHDRDLVHSITDNRGIFVLHSFLLCTGEVLIFCGHVENHDYKGISYVWDPAHPDQMMPAIPFPTGLDLFCCHYVQLPDGRILVTGGSEDYHDHGSVGAKNIVIFDPQTKTWSKLGHELDQGRWYPTSVMLGDGHILVFSGRNGGTLETTNTGDPIFRLEPRPAPEVAISLNASGQPEYFDSASNIITVPLVEVSPNLWLCPIANPGGDVLFLTVDISSGENYFTDVNLSNIFQATAPSGAGSPTFSPATGVDADNLAFIRQYVENGVRETRGGLPVLRTSREPNPKVNVPIQGSMPAYEDANGNSFGLRIYTNGRPYYQNASGQRFFLVIDITNGALFFRQWAGTEIFEGTISSTGDLSLSPVSFLTGDDVTWVKQYKNVRDPRVETLPQARSKTISDKVEILSPPDYRPNELVGATMKFPIYPGMSLAPNGKIYFIGTNWGQEIPNPTTHALTFDTGAKTGNWDDFGGMVHPTQNRREEGTYVLLPPAQDGKIMVIGGTLAENAAGDPIAQHEGLRVFENIHAESDTKTAEILDTTQNPPAWISAGNMHHGRVNGHCVILPDESVLVCGGANGYRWIGETQRNRGASGTLRTTIASKKCEIFTRTTTGGTETYNFREAAEMHHPRRYHSVALLLPNGKVFVAGGADPQENEPLPDGTPVTLGGTWADPYHRDWNGPRGGIGESYNRRDYEIYEPTYCHNGTRPNITRVEVDDIESILIPYGQEFTIVTPDASTITKVCLIRPGGPTHHTDTEQRLVDITFTANSGNLTATAPTNKNLAPPGYYMLWIVKNGLPCENAKFIRLDAFADDDDDECCIIATVCYNSRRHPDVLYLQRLRTEIATTSLLGKYFIALINTIYYSFSPFVAKELATHQNSKKVTRDLIVKPTVQCVKAAHHLLLETPTQIKYGLLIVLLSLELVMGLYFLPILLLITVIAFIKNRITNNG